MNKVSLTEARLLRRVKQTYPTVLTYRELRAADRLEVRGLLTVKREGVTEFQRRRMDGAESRIIRYVPSITVHGTAWLAQYEGVYFPGEQPKQIVHEKTE